MSGLISKYYTKDLLIISAILTLLVFLALRIYDEPLHTSAAPNGIVSFEFAYNIDSAMEILYSWDSNAKMNAGLSLGIDYLFLVVYSLFFSISVYLIAQKFDNKFDLMKKLGIALAVLLIIAGLCDAIENYALIKLLLGSENSIFPLTAYYFASLKFVIIGLALFYILSSFILLQVSKIIAR